MKLFAVYLWGEIEGTHLEMHDVRFVVGESIEDTYEELRKQWVWTNVFHIDAYIELKHIDGYTISLEKTPSKDSKKLYFVNAWAYDPNFFGELHEIGFFVWEDERSVKQEALKVLCKGKDTPHRDNLYDIDNLLEISRIWGYYIHLEKTWKNQEIKPDWYGYNTDVRG